MRRGGGLGSWLAERPGGKGVREGIWCGGLGAVLMRYKVDC